MPHNVQEYVQFRQRLLAAGAAPCLPASLYNAYRECKDSGWSAEAREWCGCLETLIARSANEPEETRAVCDYFLATRGGKKPHLATSLGAKAALAVRTIERLSHG